MTQDLQKHLRNILFIDIETVSQYSDYEQLPERLQKLWDKKAQNLKNDQYIGSDQLYFDRAAIYSEFGKVLCISFGGIFWNDEDKMCFRVKSIIDDDEKSVLNQFKTVVEKHKAKGSLMLCAHNGKEFDFPYLCRRMLVNGIDIPQVLQIQGKKPWEIHHIDTMDLWKFGDYKHFTSLDLLAAIFDIPSSKSEISGEDVNHTYHIEHKLSKIQRYCRQDVVVLAQLYLKMNNLPLIEEDWIEVVD
ncbi:MAG: 3'-5' exonuclease [Spirosomataceae bacterium]